MADTAPRHARRRRDPATRVPRSTARRAGGAAAAGLLLIALVGCGDDDDKSSSPTTTAAPATTTTETPPATTTTTEAAAGLQVDDAIETARAWIAAVGGGDDAGAIALTSSRSLDAVGGEEGFREREIELAEGWGAWDFAENLSTQVVSIDDATSIVILHGDVPQEGPPDESWAALPVVATEDGDRVEPFVDLGNIEVDPPPNSVIAGDVRFSAYVLGGRDVYFVVDAGPVSEPALQSADGDQQLAEHDVSGYSPGLHALTVVLRNDDGVMARTFLYTVA
jgi:hypothetical protein